jgi:hypothetical protein
MLAGLLPADETPVATGSCRFKDRSEAPMREFSKKDLLIFIVCLMLGAALIGLGMAYVIQFKQRIFPSGQTSRQSEVRLVRSDDYPEMDVQLTDFAPAVSTETAGQTLRRFLPERVQRAGA